MLKVRLMGTKKFYRAYLEVKKTNIAEKAVDKGEFERLLRDDEMQGESNSIKNQELICKGWFHHLIHMTAAHLW